MLTHISERCVKGRRQGRRSKGRRKREETGRKGRNRDADTGKKKTLEDPEIGQGLEEQEEE